MSLAHTAAWLKRLVLEGFMMPATTLNQILGQVVLHHRKTCALTQAVIAQRLELSQSAYSRLERGETPFTVPQIKKVSDALCLSMEEVFIQAMKTAKLLSAQGVSVLDDPPPENELSNWLWVASPVLCSAIATALVSERPCRTKGRRGSCDRN